jgi:hypothetical protein
VQLQKQTVREAHFNFYPFSEDLRLAEVILGHRCTLPLDRTRQFTLTHHPNAVIFQARPA